MSLVSNLVYLLAAINLVVFSMFGLDKKAAKVGSRRIRERTLLFSAGAFGSLGALFGMYVFRHKTRHNSFRFGVPVMFGLHVLVLVLVWDKIRF